MANTTTIVFTNSIDMRDDSNGGALGTDAEGTLRAALAQYHDPSALPTITYS